MDAITLPPGDRGVTTLSAKRDQLVIPTIDHQQRMVIPECWGWWMHGGVFYSRTPFLTFATDGIGHIYELQGSTWVAQHGE